MEVKIIEFVLMLVCGLILVRGVLIPVVIPTFSYFFRLFFSLLKKNELEKHKEALEIAKQRVRIAEIQKETMKAELAAMKIQESIIDEEFEGLNEKENFGTKK